MNPLLFAGMLALIALALVFFGKIKDWDEAQYRKHGVQAHGIVLRNQLCWGRNSVMRPLVRFTTQQGNIIEALDKNGLALAIPRFSEGEKILLVYQKSNPHDFRIISQGSFV